MSFDDAVEAARAERAADAARADDRDAREEREREAGRRELASLVSEAWRVLSEAGPPPAVEVVAVDRRGLTGRVVRRYVAGRDLRMLGSSGFAIADGQPLVRATMYRADRLRGMKFSSPPGRNAAWVLQPASLDMVSPAGYQDEFYVRDGVLVYGAEENWTPPRANTVFAQWVAESLDGS